MQNPAQMRRWQKIAFVIACLNLIAVAGLWAMLTFTDGVDFLHTTPPLLLCTPTLVLFLVSMLVRSRRVDAVNLCAVILAVFGPLAFRLGVQIPSPNLEGKPLRVATMMFVAGDEKTTISAAESLHDLAPDLLFLQGVSDFVRDPKWQKRLPRFTYWAVEGDCAIASRYPISSWQAISLSDASVGGPVALEAEVQLDDGRKVRAVAASVANAATDTAFRKALKASDGPLVVSLYRYVPLCGPGYQALLSSANLTDLFARAGVGFGWTSPGSLPLTRPDALLLSAPEGTVAIRRIWVAGAPASSSTNCPVVADLVLHDPPKTAPAKAKP